MELEIKIFADGADKKSMLASYADSRIKGFTTNPTLMRKAGIVDYEGFAREILAEIKDKPISFEVFSDDFDEMYEQAVKIASWGGNVYVKVPVMNTKGESAIPLLCRLAPTGVKVNVTAVFTLAQVREVSKALADAAACNISVFAGRIADAGVDPLPIMRESLEIIKSLPHQELIWASPREVYNVVQANDIGCHIITITPDLLNKMATLGKDLHEFSVETVQMFRTDAVAANFTLARGAL